MVDRGGEFNFFKSVHVRIDIRIDISISIRTMTIMFRKMVHLEDVIISRSHGNLKAFYLHYQSACSHQTWQNGNLP